MKCWRCEAEQETSFFCSECGGVQPLPADTNYFAALGLDDAPRVTPDALQARYYELSRQLHPDRFQADRPDELTASVQATALLNAAFRSLRDIESRGRYWLGQQGEDLGRDNNQVPPTLAALVFEVQEKLAELKAGGGDALRAEVEGVHTSIDEQRSERRATLSRMLDEWPTETTTQTKELKQLLSELSYLRTLDRDIRSGLEG